MLPLLMVQGARSTRLGIFQGPSEKLSVPHRGVVCGYGRALLIRLLHGSKDLIIGGALTEGQDQGT